MDNLFEFFAEMSSVDYFIVCSNLLVLIFSAYIERWFPKIVGDAGASGKRIWALRVLNIALLSLYLGSALLGVKVGKEIAYTGLALMLGYLFYHLVNGWLLKHYGRTRKLYDETEVHSETYQSEIFSLLASVFIVITVVLVIINIWKLNELLQATSVLGALAIIVFAAKDVWAPDNISGLIILYNADIETGSVVKIGEIDLLGVALKTTLTQTIFRDLVHDHRIIIRNSRIRECKVEVLSNTSARGLQCYVDFKIGYGHSVESVDAMLREIWQHAAESEKAISEDREPRVYVIEHDDHAVVWRLFYSLTSAYRINVARYAVQRSAYIISNVRGIGLNTPLTHSLSNALPTGIEGAAAS